MYFGNARRAIQPILSNLLEDLMIRWLVVVYEEGGFRTDERMYWFDSETEMREFLKTPKVASLLKWERVQVYRTEKL